MISDSTERYSRQLILPQIGKTGQKKLNATKILCVGAGGLGSPALLYLAAAGIGHIGIVDDDNVDVSNLQRQILFNTTHLQSKKVIAAKNQIIALNPNIHVRLYDEKLNQHNSLEILSHYDVILDCTDNFNTKYLINDACFYLNKSYVYASILQFEGQCSVFSPKQGPCYRCLFPIIPDNISNCSEAGVIGALPGIVGSIQAMEVIKLMLNIGNPLVGKLLCIDSLSMQFQQFSITQNPECDLCVKHIPLNQLQYQPTSCETTHMKEITADELNNLISNNPNILLLDVREQYEFDEYNIGGKLIPLNELPYRINELDSTQHIITLCKMGIRSKKAAEILTTHGFKNVFTLKNGLNSLRQI